MKSVFVALLLAASGVLLCCNAESDSVRKWLKTKRQIPGLPSLGTGQLPDLSAITGQLGKVFQGGGGLPNFGNLGGIGLPSGGLPASGGLQSFGNLGAGGIPSAGLPATGGLPSFGGIGGQSNQVSQGGDAKLGLLEQLKLGGG